MKIQIILGTQSGTTLLGFSGTAALGNGVTSKAVSYSGLFSDTTYSITWSITNVTDASPVLIWGVITAKSISGFTVTFNTATDSANYVLEWQAIKAA